MSFHNPFIRRGHRPNHITIHLSALIIFVQNITKRVCGKTFYNLSKALLQIASYQLLSFKLSWLMAAGEEGHRGQAEHPAATGHQEQTGVAQRRAEGGEGGQQARQSAVGGRHGEQQSCNKSCGQLLLNSISLAMIPAHK